MSCKVVFLDTMIYLHYKRVEEIPWPDLVEAEHVHILIPRITQRELDKQKDSHPQRKIRERARRVLQRVLEWSGPESTPLRKGVDIQVYQHLPRIDYADAGLDPERNDEVLLATILDFLQRNPGSDVVLVTQDTTPRITARHLGIPSMELPEELALPTEPDPVEQENREFREQLEKLKRAMPTLRLRFVGEGAGDRIHVHLRRAPENTDDYIRSEMERIRREYPVITPGAMANPAAALSILASLIPSGEFDRYNRDLEKFYEQYEQFLRTTWKTFYADHLTCRLHLEICNEGSAPGDDIDVWLRFPLGFNLMPARKLDAAKHEPPKPPREPRTSAQLIGDQMLHTRIALPSPIPLPLGGNVHQRPAPNVTGPDIQRDEGYKVHWKVGRVKHKQCQALDPLAIIFDTYESASSFGLDYRVHPVNLPDEQKGRLHVVVGKG